MSNFVMKIDGDVRFPGKIVSEYRTGVGKARIVVEMIVPGAEGLQHIYRPEQFRPMTDFERRKIELMARIWNAEKPEDITAMGGAGWLAP
jgi:hypothetical protein